MKHSIKYIDRPTHKITRRCNHMNKDTECAFHGISRDLGRGFVVRPNCDFEQGVYLPGLSSHPEQLASVGSCSRPFRLCWPSARRPSRPAKTGLSPANLLGPPRAAPSPGRRSCSLSSCRAAHPPGYQSLSSSGLTLPP